MHQQRCAPPGETQHKNKHSHKQSSSRPSCTNSQLPAGPPGLSVASTLAIEEEMAPRPGDQIAEPQMKKIRTIVSSQMKREGLGVWDTKIDRWLKWLSSYYCPCGAVCRLHCCPASVDYACAQFGLHSRTLQYVLQCYGLLQVPSRSVGLQVDTIPVEAEQSPSREAEIEDIEVDLTAPPEEVDYLASQLLREAEGFCVLVASLTSIPEGVQKEMEARKKSLQDLKFQTKALCSRFAIEGNLDEIKPRAAQGQAQQIAGYDPGQTGEADTKIKPRADQGRAHSSGLGPGQPKGSMAVEGKCVEIAEIEVSNVEPLEKQGNCKESAKARRDRRKKQQAKRMFEEPQKDKEPLKPFNLH